VENAVQATSEARRVDEAASATLEARGPDPAPVQPIPSSWTTYDFPQMAGSICFPPEFVEVSEDDTGFMAGSIEEEGVLVFWRQPSMSTGDFQSQIDWLMAKVDLLREEDPEYYTRSLVKDGRLGSPDSPAYIVITDESRYSGLVDMFILSFLGGSSDPSLLVLIRHPDTTPSKSAIDKEVATLAQIASCYRPEN